MIDRVLRRNVRLCLLSSVFLLWGAEPDSSEAGVALNPHVSPRARLSGGGGAHDGATRPHSPANPPNEDLTATGDVVRRQLRWRRFRPLVADLGRALELDVEELCRDADGRPCATVGPVKVTDYLRRHRGVSAEAVHAVCAELQDGTECADEPFIRELTPKGVHVFALGGNQPFEGRFTPLTRPGLTTPLVVDRVALLACGERVRRDLEGKPVVFRSMDLSLAVVSPATPGFGDAIVDLYRRLLARDPTDEEVDAVLGLAAGDVSLSAREAARLACFSIATTTEVLFQ